MRRKGTQVLVVVGVCSLCIVHAAWAPSAVPEIDMGATTGVFTLAVGALTLLSERLRRK